MTALSTPETGDIIIRASSLSNWADCPRRSAARVFRKVVEAAGYVLRELPSSVGASVGTAVHAAAAESLSHKAKHGVMCSEDVATDRAMEALHTQVGFGVMWDRETPEMNTAERQVLRMTQVYRAQVAPQIQPLIVEERLEAEVKPGFILSGQSDVIAREPGKIRDIKTGKSLGNHAPQIGAYSLLGRTAGIDIQAAGIDFVQRVSMKKPQPDAVMQTIPVALAETAAMNVIRAMDGALRTFMNGDAERRLLPGDPWAFLANPSSKLCGSKYCPAHSGGPNGFCREHTPVEETE